MWDVSVSRTGLQWCQSWFVNTCSHNALCMAARLLHYAPWTKTWPFARERTHKLICSRRHSHKESYFFARQRSSLFQQTYFSKFERPLYGLPKAGLHWYRTYHSLHQEKIFLCAGTHELYILFTTSEMATKDFPAQSVRGISCRLIDDTANAGNSLVIKRETAVPKSYDGKPASYFKQDSSYQSVAVISLSLKISTILHTVRTSIDFPRLSIQVFIRRTLSYRWCVVLT